MAFAQAIKKLRTNRSLTQTELAKALGVSRSTISMYESGERTPTYEALEEIADFFNVNLDFLRGKTDIRNPEGTKLNRLPILGSIRAGYDGALREEETGDFEIIPEEDLHGGDYFVLRVQGNSMYPLMLDGDRILVRRTASVDSDSLAVIIYDGDEATVKRVHYVYGEDWLELVPQNPEFMTKRIEGTDLEKCRILGQVVKLIRSIN